MKKILHVILWPIIFILGQFFIQSLFITSFNSHNVDTYKRLFPSFTDLEIIETSQYKTDLLNFMNSKVLIITLITFFIFFILFLILYKPYKKYIINSNITYKTIILVILSGILVATFYNNFIYLLNSVIHITDNYNISDIPLITLIITTGLLGPILEELLFRGIVYNRVKLYSKYPIIITSVLFALFHFNIVDIIYTFFISIILIYLYEKYNTLKISIIFHMIINITSIFITLILVQNNILINIFILLISLFLVPLLLIKLYND